MSDSLGPDLTAIPPERFEMLNEIARRSAERERAMCSIRGHLNLVTTCEDCDRVVNRARFGVYDAVKDHGELILKEVEAKQVKEKSPND